VKTIQASDITKTVAELCLTANIDPDEGIRTAIKQAHKIETSEPAKNALEMILENMAVAETERMPLCQDTGMVVVFVEIGQDVYVSGNIREAINEGVRQAYSEGYFRASVVNDPAERKNTRDNTPAVIHYDIVEGNHLKITVMPKGFGSENKSALKMLSPSAGMDGVEAFVIETIKKAGAAPCPPIIVGVGIGGTMEKAAILAKQALLEPRYFSGFDKKNKTNFWHEFEARLLEKINALNIGAAGLKGKTTALGVRVLAYPTHIAGLPVAVNIGCHVARHKSAVL